jgi:hypothetical protein
MVDGINPGGQYIAPGMTGYGIRSQQKTENGRFAAHVDDRAKHRQIILTLS